MCCRLWQNGIWQSLMGLDLLGISLHISFIFDDDDDDILLYVRPIVKRQKHF